MPISQIAFVRSTLLAILIGVAALAAIVTATLWLVGETQTNARTVTQASEERTALVDLQNLLLDAETGQRGYLLTQKDSYLEPYEQALAKIGSRLAEVRAGLESEPLLKKQIDRLTVVTKDKLAELGRTVELSKEDGRHDEAIALVNSDTGRNLMMEARMILTTLILHAERKVQDSIEREQSSMSALRLVTFAGAIIILAAALGSAFIILRYTRELVSTHKEIQELNTGLEERVKERTGELGRANEEIQRFAYIVTHDLRAPLVNIMGFTSELETSLVPIQTALSETGVPLDLSQAREARVAALEDLPEAISFIRSSTRKMDGLINAILKLSREGRRTLKPERIDLGTMLQTVADNVQHQILEAGGQVTIEGRAPPIMSDRLALEQIFGNLLDNAVKYRDRTRPLAVQMHIGNEPGRRVCVSVADNGRGIAKQDHERVFDLFRRSGAQDQQGEGIGLAHVQAMVRNLGGEITLTSELGVGTTFKVSLSKDLRKVIGDG